MDKSEKTGKGINKFVDHVVKDMINNIIVEKDFIDFVMPYNYNFKTRTGIIVNYDRLFKDEIRSKWHHLSLLENIGVMVQVHLEEAYGIPWKETKTDDSVNPIALKLYDIIVDRLHKVWEKQVTKEEKEPLFSKKNKKLITDPLDESITLPTKPVYSGANPNKLKHPKQKQLLDYVVKQMVDGTRIVPPRDGRLLLIVPEFIKSEDASPFLYARYLKTGVFPIPDHVMVRYFKDNYGLLNDEVRVVWNRYREIMYRKLKKEYPNSFRDDPPEEEMFGDSINEDTRDFKKVDNPKQHALYNKIAEDVVSLIKYEKNKKVSITDLRDPRHPGVGMSLPPPIGIYDYDIFKSRMSIVIADFFPMLENYWYIEDTLTKIFIITKFIFPKIWNNFYKSEDQPEVSTEYGDHALEYEDTKEEINESTEDDYIDKVVDQLIDETYIIKEKRTPRRGKSKWLYFVRNPFMRVTPNYRVFLYVLSQMVPSQEFEKHCREIYGATPDQIKNIWSSYSYYLAEIKPEFDTESDNLRSQIEPINESTYKEYLSKLNNPHQGKMFDRIADHLLNSIKVVPPTPSHNNPSSNIPIHNYDKLQLPTQNPYNPDEFIYLWSPGMPVTGTSGFSYDTFMDMHDPHISDITDIINEVWGLDVIDSLIIITKFFYPKLWNKYFKADNPSKPIGDIETPINESKDKEEQFLDTILKDMVNTSSIHYDWSYPTITLPYGEEIYNFYNWGPDVNVPTDFLRKYMIDTYGLTKTEITQVWVRYRDIMMEKIKENRKGVRITESTNKQQKFLDTILKDMINQSTISKSEFGIYTLVLPSGNHIFNFDLWETHGDTPPEGAINYMRDTYGMIEEEINQVWLRYKDIMLDRIKKLDDDNNPFSINEGEHKSTHKIIDKIYKEIGNNLIIDKESLFLDLPYFRGLKGILASNEPPQIFYDPFHSDVSRFDTNYVLGELKRFVAYHLLKTMGIGHKLQMRNYDPMVEPIAKKLLKDIHREAVERGFVEYDSLDELNLNESIEKIDFNKIGKVLRDPENSEQIYNLLIDMFPNAKEVIDYNYYGDNEEPNPNDSFAEMKGFLWDIDNNIIKGPTLELASQFRIENEYKEDLEQHYNDYVEGKLDKFFRESPNDPRDITPEQYENMPPIMVMNGEVMDGNHRAFLAQKAGSKLPTFEIVVEPNDHPNAQKILSIIHPNDSDEDGIPNRLDNTQKSNLNEDIQRSNKFIDMVVKDMIKDIVVEKGYIHFAMPYNEKPYPSGDRIGIIVNYHRWFGGYNESDWHRETILEDIGKMVQWHLESAYGIPWIDSKDDNNIIPIALKLYDIIVDRLHKVWGGKWLKESVDWSNKGDNKYHKNGMVNRVVGDFLKMTELTHQSVIFHMVQYIENPYQRNYNDPYLIYQYDENGLTEESKEILYEGLNNGVKWYMEHMGLIDYHPPHGIDSRSSEDKELIKMIVDTLHPLIIKAIIDHNEDEGWTTDTLYDSKYLAESTDKQEQFLEMVYQNIIDNTTLKGGNDQVYIVTGPDNKEIFNFRKWLEHWEEYESDRLPHFMHSFIIPLYGLTQEEGKIIWKKFKNEILKRINKHDENKDWVRISLDESTDKQEQYINYVIKHLMDNTKWADASYSSLLLNDDIPLTSYINYAEFSFEFIPEEISDILQGMGVTSQEMKGIWDYYNRWVLEKVIREGNLNWPNKETHKNSYPFLTESTQPKYLDKIFNSIIKEIKFDDGQHGAVIIPFISRERYSSTTGVLDRIEYQIPKHDKNIELRDDSVLHSAFSIYVRDIYGLGEEETYEVYDRFRQYIKDELYYRSVLQQILQSVQDDYIEGYGAKIDITPERTIDLKNYDDFKEYLNWWHGIIEPDYDDDGSADITNNMVKKLYDEVWDTLKNTITLNEGWPSEPDLDEEGNEKWDRMFPDKFYLKIFKMIDKDPEFFMKDILRNLGFEAEEEYDILYNYFVNYSDRKDYYVDFTIEPDDIASFFDDRDYGMEKIVKGLLEGDWDYYEWYNESFEFSDYFLDYIDEDSWKEIAKILEVDNITDAKELMSGDIGSEHLESHYELMEMRIEDIQGIIARSTTEAQADADISYLHNDIMDEVNDWFKFGEFNTHQGEFVGRVELGDVMTESSGLLQLEAELSEGYPTFDEVVKNILHEELNDWGYQQEYIFTGDEKPYINTDKHFRYGGAGTLNNEHFNEMFIDRLDWDYST